MERTLSSMFIWELTSPPLGDSQASVLQWYVNRGRIIVGGHSHPLSLCNMWDSKFTWLLCRQCWLEFQVTEWWISCVNNWCWRSVNHVKWLSYRYQHTWELKGNEGIGCSDVLPGNFCTSWNCLQVEYLEYIHCRGFSYWQTSFLSSCVVSSTKEHFYMGLFCVVHGPHSKCACVLYQ